MVEKEINKNKIVEDSSQQDQEVQDPEKRSLIRKTALAAAAASGLALGLTAKSQAQWSFTQPTSSFFPTSVTRPTSTTTTQPTATTTTQPTATTTEPTEVGGVLKGANLTKLNTMTELRGSLMTDLLDAGVKLNANPERFNSDVLLSAMDRFVNGMVENGYVNSGGNLDIMQAASITIGTIEI
ncbi:MAG: hypothetical protein ACMUJM_22060 [bacterium]